MQRPWSDKSETLFWKRPNTPLAILKNDTNSWTPCLSKKREVGGQGTEKEEWTHWLWTKKELSSPKNVRLSRSLETTERILDKLPFSDCALPFDLFMSVDCWEKGMAGKSEWRTRTDIIQGCDPNAGVAAQRAPQTQPVVPRRTHRLFWSTQGLTYVPPI